MGAIKAVFRSWDNPRSNVYRRDNDIPYSWGTAVNVQEMVFGNWSDESGTGVAFTRDPATGEKKLMGEFLLNAQGEDVVAGVRTPQPIESVEKSRIAGHVVCDIGARKKCKRWKFPSTSTEDGYIQIYCILFLPVYTGLEKKARKGG